MRSRMIAASLGIALVAWCPSLPHLSVPLLMGLMALLVLCLWRTGLTGGLLAAFGLGLIWSVLFAQWRLESVLPSYLEGRDFWVSGMVTGLPQRSARAQQVHFLVERSCFDLLPSDCPDDNSVFRNRLILLNYYGDTHLAPGQQWFWRVRLSAPRGFANPGGFDYEGWLIQQGIAARGYVRDTRFNARLGDGNDWIAQLRVALREKLLSALSERPNAGIILALVLGDRELVNTENWSLFTQTGTNHLIVISGLHVGFVAWMCFWLIGRLARLSSTLLLRVSAQQCGAFAAILGALAYSLLAGFSVPTQRACIMVLVFMGAHCLARRVPHSFSYCLALLLVLVGNPMSVVGAGFWLSFGAVGTLLLAFGGLRTLHYRAAVPGAPRRRWRARLNWRGIWTRWGRPQWVVFIGMTVPLSVWMQQLSLLSPLANVLAIPLVSLVVVPLSLLGTLLLFVHAQTGVLALHLADTLLGAMTRGLQQLVDLPLPSLWVFSGAAAGEVLLASLGSLLLLMPRGWPGKWLGLIMVLPLFVPPRLTLAPGLADITVLDAGQGLAVVVRTASHTLLYDTGPQYSENFDAGAGVIVPFLRSVGVRRLDHVMVSHGDNDHAGGLASVLAMMPAETVSYGEAPGSDRLDTDESVSMCARGQYWTWDGVHFEVLWPPAGQHASGNDSSCVLRIEANGQSVLLTGDIERGAESALLLSAAETLRSDWLLAPHHGSQTSSTEAFIEAVAPRGVIFAAGYRSQFRHPAPAVAARYHARSIPAWNTAMRGALSWRLGVQGSVVVLPAGWRQTRQRWWQARDSEASRQLHGEVPVALQP